MSAFMAARSTGAAGAGRCCGRLHSSIQPAMNSSMKTNKAGRFRFNLTQSFYGVPLAFRLPNIPPRRNSHQSRWETMHPTRIWGAILKAFKDVDQHHLLAFAGSLAYYFFMSLIPFLIFLASLLAFVPIPGLFDYILGGLSHMFPADSMAMIRKVLADLANTSKTSFLSF